MELAEMLAQVAQRGAALRSIGPMCGDCAFKPQPDINGYAETVRTAAGCLVTNGMFHCHTENYTDKGVPCKGFLYAQQYFANLDTQNDGKNDASPGSAGSLIIEDGSFSKDFDKIKE